MSQTTIQSGLSGPQYDAWLGYHAALPGANDTARKAAHLWSKRVEVQEQHEVMDTALAELSQGLGKLYGVQPEIIKSRTQGSQQNERGPAIRLGTWAGSDFAANTLTDAERATVHGEGFIIREDESQRELVIGSETPQGILYAVFHLLRELTLKQDSAEAGAVAVAVATESQPERIVITEQPVNSLRMINQWDNVDGSIERGYAGRSIFYENGEFTQDIGRIRDYARLLASNLLML